MARNKALQRKRNEAIRKRFETITRREPHWKTEYIIQMISKEFYLSVNWVVKILKGNG